MMQTYLSSPASFLLSTFIFCLEIVFDVGEKLGLVRGPSTGKSYPYSDLRDKETRF